MSSSYEQQVLQDTPQRALPHLRSITTKLEIRTTLYNAGYSDDEHRTGWKLLLAATGYSPSPTPNAADTKARATISELDTTDESLLRRVHAALGRLQPWAFPEMPTGSHGFAGR